ncbi:MAG TPA: hypothetical protein DCM05_16970 [Elusimicrobia bacterium]|nr:hypothetical protein [Elusimicrobiota bacterium]
MIKYASMKLAIAARTLAGLTGTETTVFEHARRFAALGWEVHLFAERLDAERARACGAVPRKLLRWRWGSRLKRRLFAWLFERAVSGERFDLVCGHGDTLSQDVLSLHNCVHAAHEAVHGTPLPASSGPGWMHARILREGRFRLLVANSGLMKQEVCARFGVAAGKIAVVHPGHDPARFRPEDRAALGPAARRELGVPEGAFLIGLITSGDFRKRGVALFLEALARAGLPDVHALILGQESRLAPYRELAAQTGLGGRIRFLPPTPKVERFYHALDVYCHPALYEEFGQSVQEALACGVPVLTSRRVGASELLTGSVYEGLLPDAPSVEGLRSDLSRLAKDAALRSALSQTGPAAVRGNTWDSNFDKTRALYEGLLAL